MPSSLPELLAQVRAYCAQYGEMPVEIKIVLQSGRKVCHPVPAEPPMLAARPAPGLPANRHSADYRSATWLGVSYTFTATQAACVKALWEAWEDGCPELSQVAVLDAAGSSGGHLRNLFSGHPAWGVMIVAGQKGAYRLAGPCPGDGQATDPTED